LAAIKFYCKQYQQERLITKINNCLFLDQNQLADFKKSTKSIQSLEQGLFLDFFRVVPTFADRLAYYQALTKIPFKEKPKQIKTTEDEVLIRY